MTKEHFANVLCQKKRRKKGVTCPWNWTLKQHETSAFKGLQKSHKNVEREQHILIKGDNFLLQKLMLYTWYKAIHADDRNNLKGDEKCD